MRAVLLIVNIAVLVTAWFLASLTGMLIAAGICFVLIAGFFAFSMASTEARESRKMQRAMGRNTSFLADLMGPRRH